MKKNSGLTLIEVLIAATIMFSVLSLGALAVKTFRQASEKSQKIIEINTPLLPIINIIKLDIQQQAPNEKLGGSGVVDKVEFEWTASNIKAARPINRFDADSGAFVSYDTRFYLYTVELQLQIDNTIQTYQYEELSWGSNITVIEALR